MVNVKIQTRRASKSKARSELAECGRNKFAFVIIFIAIIATVSVSGCVSQDFFGGLFGKVGDIFGVDVVKPSRQVTSVGVTNPLTIDQVWTLPEEKIIPESNMQMFMEISNKDSQTKIEAAVDVFDAGVLKDKNNQAYCNTYPNPKSPEQCGPKDGLCQAEGSTCILNPGATKQIMFEMRGPSAGDIAKVITKNKIHYKVSYRYDGATNFEVLVVDYNEIIRRQKDGKVLTTSLIDTKGSGPIKVDVELGTPYVISNADVSSTTTPVVSKAYFIFKLRNSGSGSLRDSTIPKGHFRVDLPPALAGALDEESQKIFDCVQNSVSSGISCVNKDKITFFKSESEPLRLAIDNIPQLPSGIPHRTSLISATVNDYIYELRGIKEIVVDPSLVR